MKKSKMTTKETIITTLLDFFGENIYHGLLTKIKTFACHHSETCWIITVAISNHSIYIQKSSARTTEFRKFEKFFNYP